MWCGRALLGLAMLLAQPATAAIVDYTSLHVLGDSLSDDGNLHRLTFRRVPDSPPYWSGRFSNGPVWADYLAADFAAAGLPRSNHAYGGAKARTDRDLIPDLGLQARLFRNTSGSRRGARPLVAIWAGANDLLEAGGARGIGRVARGAADAVGSVAEDLAGRGVRDFVILNLPNLGRTPRFAGDRLGRRSLARGSRIYNARLDLRVDGLRAAGSTVHAIDAFALFNALLADPEAFGVSDTTTPCLRSGRRCAPEEERERAFFDPIHPATSIHAHLADAARARIDPPAVAVAAAVAPVPLPATGALLLAGLAALAGVFRVRGVMARLRPHCGSRRRAVAPWAGAYSDLGRSRRGWSTHGPG